MDKKRVDRTRLGYSEWGLKSGSGPGWKVVPSLVRQLVQAGRLLGCWIYVFDSGAKQYVDRKLFQPRDHRAFLEMLDETLRVDAVAVLWIQDARDCALLSDSYERVTTGTIDEDNQRAVFPEPIDLRQMPALNGEEAILAVHHDGEPIFCLTATSS